MFIESLRVDSLLSFAPETPAIDLLPLNVLIGPNGSGKSNLIEAIELLRATPTAFASAIRDGGGVREWLWKGDSPKNAALDARLCRGGKKSALRYRLEFAASGERATIVDELLEEDTQPLYRLDNGTPLLSVRGPDGARSDQKADGLNPFESVLSQRKDPTGYPELTWCASALSRIQTFREWSFGRYAPVRQPQRADLPTDILLPDASNLALLVNELEQTKVMEEFNARMRRFLPGFTKLSTITRSGTIQLMLREDTLSAPVAAARLSDGTLRFIALLVTLLSPTPPPLVCIEEPELGLHPDALSLIADLLVETSERTQLIVTTHSDSLLSALTPNLESVLVCENIGGSQLRRLSSEALNHWLDRYLLGDLWRIGELGGNP